MWIHPTSFIDSSSIAQVLADEIIKNTYRTLLTRGQKGCYIYCTNKELNEYLKLKLKRGKENVRKS